MTDHEAMRKRLGWPTPNAMRTAARALDLLAFARYGDVLRWVADLCDESLDATSPRRKAKGCKRCGRETFRAEQVQARTEPLRCRGCQYVTGRCKCSPIAALA